MPLLLRDRVLRPVMRFIDIGNTAEDVYACSYGQAFQGTTRKILMLDFDLSAEREAVRALMKALCVDAHVPGGCVSRANG